MANTYTSLTKVYSMVVKTNPYEEVTDDWVIAYETEYVGGSSGSAYTLANTIWDPATGWTVKIVPSPKW